MIYLDLSHDRARLEIWFDPSVNYLARRVRMHIQAGSVVADQVVQAFKEASPGIFFPERIEMHAQRDGKPKGSWSAVMSRIKVNEPLPPNVFNLRFPRGIVVTDTIQGKMFKTDSSGEPTLPATDDKGRTISLTTAAPFPIPDAVSPFATVTQEEPRSWTRWLLPSAFGFFALAGIFWAVRRWRMAPANHH